MIVDYRGNFGAPHSTENHVKQAWERLGHTVIPRQENQRETWETTHVDENPDLILWTRTGWDWQHDCGWTEQEAWDRQHAMLDAAQEAGIPTVGFHLDRWWGLDREGQIYEEPFFRCSTVITADGSDPQAWKDAGVNHVWMPPGVSLAETERNGRRLPRTYPQQVAFVGSWRLRRKPDGGTDGYHDEWGPHRLDMLDACRAHFGRKFGCYPAGRALRGQPLADLYATVPVMVGDSCLAPFLDPPRNYWSDRVPETLGRGGLLVHPDVDGTLRDQYPLLVALQTYDLGNYGAMIEQIEQLLSWPEAERKLRAEDARAWVQKNHTYERRVEQIIDLLNAPG